MNQQLHIARRVVLVASFGMSCLSATVAAVGPDVVAVEGPTPTPVTTPVWHSSRDLQPIIETKQQTYPTGNSVVIRVGLRNLSSKEIVIIMQAPWTAAVLTVTGLSGLIQRGLPDIEHNYLATEGYGVVPGAVDYATWSGES